MAIKTIEIMCFPCLKCERLMTMIHEMIRNIERINNIKITYSFKYTPHLRDINKYSLSPSQVPIVIINGAVEFAGIVKPDLLKMKLESIHKIG